MMQGNTVIDEATDDILRSICRSRFFDNCAEFRRNLLAEYQAKVDDAERDPNVTLPSVDFVESRIDLPIEGEIDIDTPMKAIEGGRWVFHASPRDGGRRMSGVSMFYIYSTMYFHS